MNSNEGNGAVALLDAGCRYKPQQFGLRKASEERMESAQFAIETIADDAMIDGLQLQPSFIGFAVACEPTATQVQLEIPAAQAHGIAKLVTLIMTQARPPQAGQSPDALARAAADRIKGVGTIANRSCRLLLI